MTTDDESADGYLGADRGLAQKVFQERSIKNGSHWRHVARGSTYRIVGAADVQASTRPLVDGDSVVLYQSDETQNYHVRLPTEFLDGRFEQLDINKPYTQNFLSSVAIEADHQIERWGEAHDRSKSAENWFWLVGFLAGKALRANLMGDKPTALHHTISAAAALYQWHSAILAGNASGSGEGEDIDLKPSDDEPSVIDALKQVIISARDAGQMGNRFIRLPIEALAMLDLIPHDDKKTPPPV